MSSSSDRSDSTPARPRYDTAAVSAAVLADIDRLFSPWLVGRPANYSTDTATKQLIALGYWLREELQRLGCNEADIKTQLWKYNRLSRTYDVWQVAAECLNDVLDGAVEQGRIGHRRWG